MRDWMTKELGGTSASVTSGFTSLPTHKPCSPLPTTPLSLAPRPAALRRPSAVRCSSWPRARCERCRRSGIGDSGCGHTPVCLSAAHATLEAWHANQSQLLELKLRTQHVGGRKLRGCVRNDDVGSLWRPLIVGRLSLCKLCAAEKRPQRVHELQHSRHEQPLRLRPGYGTRRGRAAAAHLCFSASSSRSDKNPRSTRTSRAARRAARRSATTSSASCPRTPTSPCWAAPSPRHVRRS